MIQTYNQDWNDNIIPRSWDMICTALEKEENEISTKFEHMFSSKGNRINDSRYSISKCIFYQKLLISQKWFVH